MQGQQECILFNYLHPWNKPTCLCESNFAPPPAFCSFHTSPFAECRYQPFYSRERSKRGQYRYNSRRRCLVSYGIHCLFPRCFQLLLLSFPRNFFLCFINIRGCDYYYYRKDTCIILFPMRYNSLGPSIQKGVSTCECWQKSKGWLFLLPSLSHRSVTCQLDCFPAISRGRGWIKMLHGYDRVSKVKSKGEQW